MKKLEPLAQIGRVLKTHGKSGEIKLALEDGVAPQLVKKLGFLFIEHFGSRVPYRIVGRKGSDLLILKLEDIDNPEEAADFQGASVYVTESEYAEIKEQAVDDPMLEWLGYLILDKVTGHRVGEIKEIWKNKSQLLSLVDALEDNAQYQIPLHSDWIVHIDKEARLITMELPEGLLDL